MQIEFGQDHTGPVVIKRPTNPQEAQALAHEAELLARVNNIGVVILVSNPATASETGIVTRRVPGPTSAEFPPQTPAEIAGWASAVARVLADLHDIGVAHGALDPTNILVAPNGQPVLCGWSHWNDDTPGDVSALGQLILDFLVHVDPEGATGIHRTASGEEIDIRDRYLIESLREIAESATSPVPLKRPTARILANTILERIPQARVPTPPPVIIEPVTTPAAPRPKRMGGESSNQTRIITYAVLGGIVLLGLLIVGLRSCGDKETNKFEPSAQTVGPGATITTVEGCPGVNNDYMVDFDRDGCFDDYTSGVDENTQGEQVTFLKFGNSEAVTLPANTSKFTFGDWTGDGFRTLAILTTDGTVYVLYDWEPGSENYREIQKNANIVDIRAGNADGSGPDDIILIYGDGSEEVRSAAPVE